MAYQCLQVPALLYCQLIGLVGDGDVDGFGELAGFAFAILADHCSGQKRFRFELSE